MSLLKEFKTRVSGIFQSLNMVQKAKDNTLDEADWKAISDAYKQQYKTELIADQAEFERLQAAQIEKNKVLEVLNGVEELNDNHGGENAEGGEGNNADGQQSASTIEEDHKGGQSAGQQQDVVAMVTRLANLVTIQTQQIKTMASKAAVDKPEGHTTLKVDAMGLGTNATHLFGIEHPMFSMSERWNKIAANPAVAATLSVGLKDEEKFQNTIQEFAISLKNRYATLQSENRLNPKILSENFTFTTSDLSDAKLGDQFVVRRQDQLIARIVMLNSVAALFPTRYNVQDRELITNAFFTEVTQGFQTGQIFKGGMSLQPEFGHVDDLMIKVQFGSMKEIERMYIGYLNTSGSDPIKWNMIEFALFGLYKQAMNEYNKRKIMGIAVKPESGKAAYYLTGSTGVIYTIIRYIHENKLLPHADDDTKTYTASTMLAVVKAFLEAVRETMPVDTNLDGFEIMLNANHKQWWKSCIRTTYGKETDFTGPDSYVNVVPDEDVKIRWCPNMGKLTFVLLEQPGNIQFLENIPGEPLAIKMKEDMEEVKAWSTFKEGTTASFVGKKFASRADLVANAYNLQQIFCNKPSVDLTADSTTIDGKENFWFETQSNTAAKALTDIENAVKGVAYIIECQGLTNPTTIAKSGKFANIKSAYTPTALHDYIMVILNTDGDGFLELERCVGGTRTVNSDLQPNIPGAR